MKFIFVVPPFVGHVLPTVSVGRALAQRGHEVAWVGYESVRPLLPAGAELFALEAPPMRDGPPLVNEARGFEAMRAFFEDIVVPLARAMLPGVAAAIEVFGPDVVVADQQALAGAFAARRAGKRWVTFSTTSVALADPLVLLVAAKRWLTRLFAQLEAECGLPPTADPDVSPELVVVFSSREFAGPNRDWPPHYRFVGPATLDRADPTPFPWDALGPRPRLFVSLGTAGTPNAATARFYAAVVEGLRAFDGQVIVVAPEGVVCDPPPTFVVRERVPQLALLPHVDAVISHGGHNTVCESLANGLPLLVSPMRHDQPAVADLVVAAGAGLVVRYGRVTPAKIREAVGRLLGETAFREAATRIRESFERAGGAPVAAAALEGLA